MDNTPPTDLAFFVRSDARCMDKKVGQLLGKYLFQAVNAEEKDVFESHLEDCLPCWTDVTNWNNLKSAKRD